MENIFWATNLLVQDNPLLKRGMSEFISRLASIGETDRERFRAGMEYLRKLDSTRSAKEIYALFVEALTARLAANRDEAGLALLQEAADRLLECADERKAHNWATVTMDCRTGEKKDYSQEAAAWDKARRAFGDLMNAVMEGVPLAEKARKKELVDAINTATVTGGYTLRAKVWKGYGKERIYINVSDPDGKPQPESLYLEGDEIHWKGGKPDPRPVWADEVVAVIRKAAEACAPDGQ